MTAPPACASCLHFAPAGDADGFCHRYPPAVFMIGETLKSAFPPVRREFACGEFAAMPAADRATGDAPRRDRPA
jgi:hypothetical protein